ncbi:MAG: hypothetical protein ABI199_00210 [Bacteroidia bacterium]
MKKIIFFFIASISIISCTERQTSLFDNKDNNKYGLQFELFGDNCDKKRITIYFTPDILEDTLIVDKYYNSHSDSCDSRRVSISKIDQDSLYTFFKDAMNKFKINGERPNKKISMAIKLTIFSTDKTISTSYLNLKDLNKDNPDITQLVNFLNRRIGRKSQINY